ncbi:MULTISPECIES: EspF repeat-containing protein [Bacillus]|uniref:EspF repeat-containing protein n=1 Tax=Bacillus TaxID=1386 RepID=UPI003399D304
MYYAGHRALHPLFPADSPPGQQTSSQPRPPLFQRLMQIFSNRFYGYTSHNHR